ncbi:MAG TPA: hypothetical protein VNK82_05890 [Terriglobales bacterium]|nr:hypothetical protein [Terriglobales bacterium]
MSEIEKLKKEITKADQLLADLQRREAEAHTRSSAAQSRRQELASDALLAGLPVPEKECDRLDAEAQKASREAADYGAAAPRVAKKLADLRRDLAIAEAGALKAQVQELISQRKRPLSQIDSAVRTLTKAVEEIDAVDSSIADLVTKLDSARFTPLIGSLRRGSRSTVRQFVENAFTGKLQDELAATQARFSEAVITSISGLPIGEVTDGLKRYKAVGSITGLRCQALKPGDEILAEASEVAELVERGVLIAVAGA